MRVFIAFVCALTLTVGLSAYSGYINGCSKDHRLVALKIIIDDEAAGEHQVKAHVTSSFIKVAASMTAEELQSAEGFQAFVAALDQDDIAATSVEGAPISSGICREE